MLGLWRSRQRSRLLGRWIGGLPRGLWELALGVIVVVVDDDDACSRELRRTNK